MNNKKGVSAIVATVLIILITVAAVTIIWAAIIPMIEGELDGATACLDVAQDLQIGGAGYTCWNSTHLKVQVNAGSQIDTLQNLQFLVGEAGTTVSFNLFDSSGGLTNGITGASALSGANSNSVYIFEQVSLFSGITPDSVGIAPIITFGNSINTCDVSAEFSPIPTCI